MEKKAFLSSLVEYALEMVLAFDSKGIINYANAGAKEKLGDRKSTRLNSSHMA